MHIGHKISGAAHLALLAWMALGDVFAAEPLPLATRDVSVISGAEFAALQAGRPPSEAADAAQPPEQTGNAPEAPEPAPAIDVPDQAPVLEQPGGDVVVAVPRIDDEAVPQPEERIAPAPVARPETDAQPDIDTSEAVREDSEGESTEPVSEARAPEAAATEIVTEAERPARVLETSPRPPARRPVPVAPPPVVAAPETPPAQTAETEQKQPPAADPDPTPEDAITAALEEALGGAQDTPGPVQEGPPLSVGEREALRVSVSECWNVGSLSTDALATTVVVAMSMTPDGRPLADTIRLLSSTGGSDAAARQAFEAARRAIIRCGARGFDLPVEKYGQWQQIEMTFNPERMRDL